MFRNKQSAIKSGRCWYNIRLKQKTKTEQNKKKTKKKNAQSLRCRARQMCCHMLVLIAWTCIEKIEMIRMIVWKPEFTQGIIDK